MGKPSTSTPKSLGTGSDTPEPYVAVLIPTRGTLFTDTIRSLLQELAPYRHAFFFTKDQPIPDCRNLLVREARRCGIPFTHYLMVDDDVILPEGGLDAMLEAKEPAIIIDYPTHALGKGANRGNVAYDKWLPGETDVAGRSIAWAGLGCALVDPAIFNKLRYPYFRKGGKLFDRGKEGELILYGEGGGDGGEDYEFYQDLKAQGYQVKQVEGMVAGHAKIMRHVGVVEQGKYLKQHDIHIANKIEAPFK